MAPRTPDLNRGLTHCAGSHTGHESRRLIECDTTFATEQAEIDAETAAITESGHFADQKRASLRDRANTLAIDRNVILTGRWSEGSRVEEVLDVRGLTPLPNRRHVLNSRFGLELNNRRIEELNELIATLDTQIANVDVQIAELEQTLNRR